ncbi:MAG: peptidoglycan DD-metalloendopeptidase family protein [Oscillospiraceae bacterium]|nr:peptidoglycan DD-metalloendopeptidase family protein [Oscillospiraceae bacterium]
MCKKKHILSVLAVFLSLVLFFNLMGGVQPASVSAASSSQIKEELNELEERNAEIEAELNALRGQLSDNRDELESLVAQKDLVDQEIVLLYEQMEVVNQQITVCAQLIADKQEEVDQAQARLQELQQKNLERIRAMEENGELSYWSVLSGASSFMEMLDRWEMVQEIAEADKKCLEELDKAAAEVAAARDALAEDQAELQNKRDQMDAVEQVLAQKRVETDALLIEMKAKGDEYEAMIEESEQMQEELMQEIANKKEEYQDAKDREQASSPVIGGATTTVNGIQWTVPCSYWRVSSPFGYRYHPLSGIWKMHNGVDLTGPEGTPIVATRSGYVTTAAYQAGGAGNYVSLSHGDGFGSIYMHMTHYVVSYGQYVEAGQVIGYMGTTGGSTGVHLHFGISYNGVYVNPAEYIPSLV